MVGAGLSGVKRNECNEIGYIYLKCNVSLSREWLCEQPPFIIVDGTTRRRCYPTSFYILAALRNVRGDSLKFWGVAMPAMTSFGCPGSLCNWI